MFFGMIGALIGIFISMLSCILLLLYSGADKFILLIYKAHPALPGELPIFNEKLLKLSARYGVPVPSIFITEAELPGSFIIGKDMQKTTIVIPTRFSTILKSEEIEAVFAHNIVQIDNTIRKRTIVALIAGTMTMAASAIRWGAVFTGFGDYNEPAPKLFGLFVMGLAAPPAAALIYSTSMKDHDAQAAVLCKDKDALISAIETLEANNVTGYSSLGHLCIVDPKKETFFEYLFNMHQPMEIRKKILTGQKV
jgi:Zn-dependent protease with chaperone function